jgi:putative transposase
LRSSEAKDEEVDLPKKQHSGEQIIGALKQYDVVAMTVEICRKLRSTALLLSVEAAVRRARRAGLHELRQPREENSRLKRIVADLTLDPQMLPEAVSIKL